MTRIKMALTVDGDVIRLLKKLADSDDRSMAKYIEKLIRREAEEAGIKINAHNNSKTRKERSNE